LLIGAPGNGKTEEARAAADALGLKVIYANGDDFATEASSNRFYNNLVNETVNANGRYAIFFDEIDSIFTNRALIKDVASEQKGAVTVFNNFVTRMQNSPELMKKFAGMMGTTNLAPDALDTALTSRFPQQLHVPRFDESDARQFLRVELEPISITANTTKDALIGTLATIMANKNMDARKALNLIDEVWSYAKSNMDATPAAGEDESFDDDASADVIVKPRYLISAFNGMKIGDDEKKSDRISRWDRGDVSSATTRPSTPLKNDDRISRWDSGDDIDNASTRPSIPLKNDDRISRWDRDDDIGNASTRPSTPLKY
jgi:SpoVK/Ycf46/Vps4 family AAA+-type ATPase